MSDTSKSRDEVAVAAAKFAEMFWVVFDNDWEATQGRILDEWYISPEGTFLNPGVEDESNNWGNRGGLLAAYRNLVEVLDKHGVLDSETMLGG